MLISTKNGFGVNRTDFNRRFDVRNPQYRQEWVEQALTAIASSSVGALTLLDVGAGTGPFREHAVNLGYEYSAHDFGKYSAPNGSSVSVGYQSVNWRYTQLDYECDILDIPTSAQSDVVLSSEVLEHVPDPVKALSKLAELTRPGGHLLITVPLLSLMHMAPYWFATGLSPYFFEHWLPKMGLTCTDVTLHGDYADLMRQEISRAICSTLRRPLNGRLETYFVGPAIGHLMRFARKRMTSTDLEAGGFGVTVLASRPSNKTAPVAKSSSVEALS